MCVTSTIVSTSGCLDRLHRFRAGQQARLLCLCHSGRRQQLVGGAFGHDAVHHEYRIAFRLQLRQQQRQVSVGHQLRPGEQRVEVEPLLAELSDREPVLLKITNVRLL